MSKKDLNRLKKEYKQKIKSIYEQEVLVQMPELEKFRREKQVQAIVGLVIVGIYYLLLLSGIILFDNLKLFNIVIDKESTILSIYLLIFELFIILLLLILPWLLLRNKNKNFSSHIKSKYVKAILEKFDNIKWMQYDESVIPDDKIEKSDLFMPYNLRDVDDTFIGCHSGVDFKIAETNLLRKSGTGKYSKIVPVFEGILVNFKSNKNTEKYTMVSTRNIEKIKNSIFTLVLVAIGLIIFLPAQFLFGEIKLVNIIFGIIAISAFAFPAIFEIILYLRELKREDSDFSKQYVIHTQDRLESQYLVTPSLINCFENLQKAFSTHDIKCAFFGNEVMLSIATKKDVFEVGKILRSMKDGIGMDVFIDELTSILVMIDNFKIEDSEKSS